MCLLFFFFKRKTAYEMRISDWSSDVCSSDLEKTLVSAVTAAGLAEMLSGDGPYTVFAPSDAAFQQVPVVTRNGWMRPAQKDVLAGVLKYHVVPGKLAAADLAAKIEQGGGKAVLTTVDGQELTASMNGDKILLTAASGDRKSTRLNSSH